MAARPAASLGAPIHHPLKMHRPLIPCILALLACACASEPKSALPNPVDVSGDDCTASVLVYDRPPPKAADAEPGVAFINDGCSGERIFLGIDGARRELRRAEDRPLGSGGTYSDGEYRVLVERGRIVRRGEVARPPDAFCPEPAEREFDASYEARVRIWSKTASWSVDGTLLQNECGP